MTLKPMSNRNAAFVSVIVAFDPQGGEHIFEGRMEGEIAKAARGNQGFGYDPAFIPQGETKTLAELGVAVKNKISHRAKAASGLMTLLESSIG